MAARSTSDIGPARAGEPPEPSPGRLPPVDWTPWGAPLALVGGLVLAAIGGLIVDIPASLLGARVSGPHVSGGVELADTIVQDLGFILAAVMCARIGGAAVSAWRFGLRPTRLGRAIGLVLLTLIGFIFFSVIWAAALNVSTKEKVLEQLGANEATVLLLGSALLTCVVAPVCEEFLFRGYVFRALSNWKGTWPAALMTAIVFGGFHVGSAPVVDLVPLAALGFGLCLLYRATGSLYPCIAVHSLNNSLAFGELEEWGWQTPVLMASALLVLIAAALIANRAGLSRAGGAEGVADTS